MTTTIKPIPDGCHTLTPYLVVQGAAEALDFYQKAFGASELFRLEAPGGKIAHAEFKIGDSTFMLADENPQCTDVSPKTLGGTPVKLHLYVADTDAVFAAAIQAGATETMPPSNQFWGDRMGAVTDPFGHHWLIATHVEDVDPNELQGRMESFFASQTACAQSLQENIMDKCNLHGAFSWCELLTTDTEAAKHFYGRLFDWTLEPAPMPGIEYNLVKYGGEHRGGIMKMPAQCEGTPPHWGVYVTVDDVDATAKLAEEMGGKVCLPPQDIPGVGRFCVLQDPQGAMINAITYLSKAK